MRQRAQQGSGFSLIEVLLAVALSVTLMALLGSAINMYLLRVDASRSEVQQAQLARGILRLMADDLRSAAVIYEQDTSSVADAAASQALFDVDQADETPPADTGTLDTAVERPYVGVSGDLQSIQVDVLRLRPAYTIATDGEMQTVMMDYLSPGIAGVRYFLNELGLVRQQVGRDVAVQQQQQGLQQTWEQSQRIVASEVVDLRFRYNDGVQTREYWDMQEQQGVLPVAVEVRIGLRPSNTVEGEPVDPSRIRYYRIVAPMPTPPGGAESADTEATGETSTTAGGAL